MGVKRKHLILLLCLCPAFLSARSLPLHQLILPQGFKISLFSGDVPNARSMSLSPSGTLFVGSRSAGKVYALVDKNRDGKADRVYVIAEGLNNPNGVAFYKGSLYVAEINRILRYDKIEWLLHQPPEPVVVSTDFPSDAHHGWKFIRIGPDEKLYVPIGAPCNVCLEYGYAAITRLNLDGSVHEIYAEGVRNTMGFDWHPDTKELWFTDNGRDQLSDNKPADELNRAPKRNMHFGFPHCHGGDVLDPEYGLGHMCREYEPPAQQLQPHVAALGMRFYTGKMFPPEYRKQVFIAEHGSKNRSSKVGFQISMVRLDANRAISYTAFVQGWLQGEEAWGRPVDVEVMPDGSMLISDDKAGAIYRVVYQASPVGNGKGNGKGKAAPNTTAPAIQQPTSQPDAQQPEKKPEQQAQPNQATPPAEVLQRHHQRPVEQPQVDPFSNIESQAGSE